MVAEESAAEDGRRRERADTAPEGVGVATWPSRAGLQQQQAGGSASSQGSQRDQPATQPGFDC